MRIFPPFYLTVNACHTSAATPLTALLETQSCVLVYSILLKGRCIHEHLIRRDGIWRSRCLPEACVCNCSDRQALAQGLLLSDTGALLHEV